MCTYFKKPSIECFTSPEIGKKKIIISVPFSDEYIGAGNLLDQPKALLPPELIIGRL